MYGICGIVAQASYHVSTVRLGYGLGVIMEAKAMFGLDITLGTFVIV